jgi:hypothetical protein
MISRLTLAVLTLAAAAAWAGPASDGDAAMAKKDYAAALAAYERGADVQDAKSMNGLGMLYMKGHGVALDYAEGVKWLRKSAELGDPMGMLDYGTAFHTGHGVRRDYEQAMKWYRAAAYKGNVIALNDIGLLYEHGSGVVQDYVTAYAFYILAGSRGGSANTQANIKRLAALMTKEQIAIAQKQAVASAAPFAQAQQANAPAKWTVDQPMYRYPPREDDFAVVVGVEKYPALPPATYAERDARSVHQHLVAMGYPERNILVLIGQDATKARLTAAVNSWLPRRVNARSKVVFYYSGHGAPDPVSKLAYLVPVDGQPEDLPDTAMPLKQLYEKLGALKARKVLVALDSCFSGSGGRSVLPKGARPLVSKVDEGPGAAGGKIIALTASDGEQISGVLDEQKHGAFTFYFLTGLNAVDERDAQGQSQTTIQGLYRYLKPRVADAARLQNRDQVPQLDPPDADFYLISVDDK